MSLVTVADKAVAAKHLKVPPPPSPATGPCLPSFFNAVSEALEIDLTSRSGSNIWLLRGVAQTQT